MILTAFLKGLVWSALWIIYVYVIVTRFPWKMMHDYPKDIQEASTLPEPTDKQKHNSSLFGIIGALVIFGAVIAFGLCQFKQAPISFWSVFFFIFIIAMSWNVIDLLIMDWLIICTLTCKWVVIPGTEGCKGYKDYFYHFKAFLIGCVYSTLMALAVAGLDYTILRLLIWR